MTSQTTEFPTSASAQIQQPQAAEWDDAEPSIDLMEYAHLIWNQRWIVIGVAVVVVILAAAWSLTRPKMYQASATIILQPSPNLTNNAVEGAMNWYQMDRIIANQVQILTTRSLAERTARELGLAGGNEKAGAGILLGGLSVKPIDETFAIRLSMTGRDPQQVAQWLNVYLDEYIEANIEDGIQRSRQVFEVIQSRLDPLRDRVFDAEQALMRFQERDDAVLFADQDKNVITEQVDRLTSEYADAKAERIRLETQLNALENVRTSDVSSAGLPEVLRTDTLSSLRRQRDELQAELKNQLRSLKEGHPVIQDLRAQLASVDARLDAEIGNIRQSLQTEYDIVAGRERRLYQSIQNLKEQSIELSKQTLEYDRLHREYEQNKGFLEQMLALSNQADIAQTATLNNVRIIQPAIAPGGPYSPNVQRNLLTGILLGLVLGMALVITMDLMDQTLRTPDEVERHVGIEVLSALPKFDEGSAHALRESFQATRTALMLAARGEGCHVVQVTSAVPSEGKTTVAFNLAKVLSMGGSRVLLIDCDLRKPRLHKVINAKNVRGLTSVVLGERETEEVTHTLNDVPNLDVITSGPLPPNPPELFGKSSFSRLLDAARTRYDWVIVDTPPVASVTDPVMCARTVDLVLLVIQYAGAKRQVVHESVRLLSRTGVRVAGALLNKVDMKRDSYYYSTYYSYYHYGHYGDEPSTTPVAKTDAGQSSA